MRAFSAGGLSALTHSISIKILTDEKDLLPLGCNFYLRDNWIFSIRLQLTFFTENFFFNYIGKSQNAKFAKKRNKLAMIFQAASSLAFIELGAGKGAITVMSSLGMMLFGKCSMLPDREDLKSKY